MRKQIAIGILVTVAIGSAVRAQQPTSPIRRIAQVTIVVEDQDVRAGAALMKWRH